jgi:putative serine protease XkdF
MPYDIAERDGQFCVVKREGGKQIACHATRSKAEAQIRAIMASEHSKRLDCKVAKVDDSLGLVFGWAIICTEDGEPYVDTQDDYITDAAMLQAATEFAKGRRMGGDMHEQPDGQVVHIFPLTAEIAKAFGIKCDKTGLMVAMQPSPETLAKFRSGERTGFSIGGERVDDNPMEID